jgi:hypothetical protein
VEQQYPQDSSIRRTAATACRSPRRERITVADLIVDSSLDDVNSALKDISDEFQHAQDNADPGFSVWGQWDLSRAMHDFAHNWSIHRGKIQGRLGTLSKHVDQSCQTWSDADKQLASSLATDDVPAAAAAAGASGTERVGTVAPNSGAGGNAAAASGTERVGTVIPGGGAGENAAAPAAANASATESTGGHHA